MKFLLNENIAPSFSIFFQSIGWRVSHVVNLGLRVVSDSKVVEYAQRNGFFIITHDLDYSRIVSLLGSNRPSVLTLRLGKITFDKVTEIINNNRIQITHYLQQGALVTIDEEKIRYRSIPIHRS